MLSCLTWSAPQTALDSSGQRVVFTDTQIYITSCLDHLMATKHHQPAMAEIDDLRNEPTCHKSINYPSGSFDVNFSAKAKSTQVSNLYIYSLLQCYC